MGKYPFIKSEKDIVYATNALETLDEYFFNLLNMNVLKSSTYFRLSAGINCFIAELKNIMTGNDTENIYVNLENLNLIQKNSKAVEVDTDNIKVKDCLKVIVDVLARYVQVLLKRENKEIADEDVDNLLKAVEIINKNIDSNQ